MNLSPIASTSSQFPTPSFGGGPPRIGQPASTRNFNNSSAGGARNSRANGINRNLSEGEKAKVTAWGESYVVEEDSIRNDYSSQYVQTGARPQNFVTSSGVEERFKEYPKLCSLLAQKHSLYDQSTHSIPPTFLQTPSPSTALATLTPSRFDVILITPPPTVSYEEIKALDLTSIASTPGFIWLWVGSGQRGDGIGLEKGRELFLHWGYRRCEDIVWLKTNKGKLNAECEIKGETVFTSTIEHCLMGIRGTVRRSNDPWFVHCNVDTDVLVWEGDEFDQKLKPPELQSLIENFCLGTRRLHLYGSPHSLRRGWLTVGDSFDSLDPSNSSRVVNKVEGESTNWQPIAFEKSNYMNRWKQIRENGSSSDYGLAALELEERVESLLPFVEELDALRPKSPPGRNGQASSGGLGRGRGAGLGVTRTNHQNGNMNSNYPIPTMNPRGGSRGSLPSFNGYSSYQPIPIPPPPPQWNPYQNSYPSFPPQQYQQQQYQQQQYQQQQFQYPPYSAYPPQFQNQQPAQIYPNYNSSPAFYPSAFSPASVALPPGVRNQEEYQNWLMNGSSR